MHQWQLETIVPKKEGSLLLVLRGEHKVRLCASVRGLSLRALTHDHTPASHLRCGLVMRQCAMQGQRAKLLHRNVKAGAAAVQLLAEMEVVKISFDDIADYVGGDDD